MSILNMALVVFSSLVPSGKIGTAGKHMVNPKMGRQVDHHRQIGVGLMGLRKCMRCKCPKLEVSELQAVVPPRKRPVSAYLCRVQS